MDPSKLKVIELRAELAKRGLDIRGVKAVLVERLNAFLLEEDGGAISEESSEAPEEILPDLPETQSSPKEQYEHNVGHHEDEGPIPLDDDDEEEEEEEREENKIKETIIPIRDVEPTVQMETVLDEITESRSSDRMEATSIIDCPSSVEKDDIESNDSINNKPTEEQEEQEEELETSKILDESSETVEQENLNTQEETERKEEHTEEDEKMEDVKDNEETEVVKPDVEKNEDHETKTDSEKDVRDTSDRRRRNNDDRRRKRQRSGSPQRRDRRSPGRNQPVPNSDDFAIDEDEPVLDEKSVTLSWYDSDLNLKIQKDTFLGAKPISDIALGFAWAGARGTHGIKEGRVLYEVEIVGQNTFSTSFSEQNNVHEIMCGWSTPSTNLQLGDSPLSFGYSGLGKKCVNNEFTDYGCKIEMLDIVGVYIDLDSSPCTIEYTVNGKSQGIAFEFDKTELGEEALFPHIMSKNFIYTVNFGQEETFLKHVKPKSKKKPIKETQSDKKESICESEEIKTIDENNVETVEEKKEEETIKENDEKEEEKIKEDIPKDNVESAEKNDDDVQKEEEDVVMSEFPLEPKLTNEVKEDEPVEENKTEDENIIEEEEEIEEGEKIELILLPDYIYISKITEESLIAGPRRPDTRQECEVYLLVGLPGSGKTHWALNHAKENVDKRFNILGTFTLLGKMGFAGENKAKFVGRYEKLIESCTRSVIILQELACKRRRNYILDQTNVYASAQRRKMRGFGEFKRIAVVIIPEDEEYKRRYEKKIEIEGKEVPDIAVNELKANFALPSIEFGWFTEVRFTELDSDAAKTIVSDYNEKGRQALPPQQSSKRRRYNERDNRRDNNRNNNRDQRHHQQRWNGPMDRRGGRNDRWGPGPPPGQWGRYFDRRDRGPWGGGGPGNWMPNKRGPRFDDRGYRGPPPPLARNDRDRRDFRGGDRGPPRGQTGRNGRDDKKGPKDLMSKSSSSGGDSRNGGSKSYSSGSSQGNWGQAGNWSGGSGSSQSQYGNWGGYGQTYNQGWGNNWNQGNSGSGGYGSQWASQPSSNTQSASGGGSSGSGQWKNYGTSQSQSTGSSSANNSQTTQQQQLQQQQWMNWWQQQQQQQGGSSNSGSGGTSSSNTNNQTDANMAAWQNWAQYAQAYYNNNPAGTQTNPKSSQQSVLDSNNKK